MTLPTRSRRSRIALAGGWLLAVGMAGVALDRWVGPETVPLLIGIQGIAVWLLIPALPLAVAAAWRRKWTLAAVAAVLAAGQLTWALPVIGWHGTQDVPAGAFTLRLVTANVLLNNPEIAALGAELTALDADVVLLQEVTPEIMVALEQTPLWSAYPERVLDALPGFHGSAILSRLPITAGRAIDVAGYPMTRADLDTPAGPLRVVNVHAVAPVNDENTARWRAQMDAMAQMQAPAGSALVMGGDFNATVDHAPFRRVLAGGKRDAFLVAGSGYGATWPNWSGPVFPVMRLDHVLLDPRLTAVSITERDSPGSDHRQLLAEIAVPALR